MMGISVGAADFGTSPPAAGSGSRGRYLAETARSHRPLIASPIGMLPRRAALVLPLLWLTHCGGPPPPPNLELTVVGGADQNPDADGHPTTVAIRLYQLASDSAFDRADVFALTEREAATLGADDLGSEEIVIAPGERRTIAHPLKVGARILCVVVLFREIDRATWRTQAPLAAQGATKLLLTIAATHVTLS
jgi:type VI secretion system protein VasD